MWFRIVRKAGFVTRASVRNRGFRVVYVWSASLALVLCVREMKRRKQRDGDGKVCVVHIEVVLFCGHLPKNHVCYEKNKEIIN